jgi:hypothetical protein
MRCGSAAIEIVPNIADIIADTIKKTKLRFTVIVRSSSFFASHRFRIARQNHIAVRLLNGAAGLWQIYGRSQPYRMSAAL